MLLHKFKKSKSRLMGDKARKKQDDATFIALWGINRCETLRRAPALKAWQSFKRNKWPLPTTKIKEFGQNAFESGLKMETKWPLPTQKSIGQSERHFRPRNKTTFVISSWQLTIVQTWSRLVRRLETMWFLRTLWLRQKLEYFWKVFHRKIRNRSSNYGASREFFRKNWL